MLPPLRPQVKTRPLIFRVRNLRNSIGAEERGDDRRGPSHVPRDLCTVIPSLPVSLNLHFRGENFVASGRLREVEL